MLLCSARILQSRFIGRLRQGRRVPLRSCPVTAIIGRDGLLRGVSSIWRIGERATSRAFPQWLFAASSKAATIRLFCRYTKRRFRTTEYNYRRSDRVISSHASKGPGCRRDSDHEAPRDQRRLAPRAPVDFRLAGAEFGRAHVLGRRACHLDLGISPSDR